MKDYIDNKEWAGSHAGRGVYALTAAITEFIGLAAAKLGLRTPRFVCVMKWDNDDGPATRITQTNTESAAAAQRLLEEGAAYCQELIDDKGPGAGGPGTSFVENTLVELDEEGRPL